MDKVQEKVAQNSPRVIGTFRSGHENTPSGAMRACWFRAQYTCLDVKGPRLVDAGQDDL